MAWPDDQDLPIEVQAAFGADVSADPGTWSWTDLSSRLAADPIRIRAGRSSGAGQVSPGTCTVTLDNDDAALTPLHPMSPWWPYVDTGTPLRVRLRRAEDSFARTVSSGWGATTSGQAWTVSSGPASDFSVSGGVGRHSMTSTTLLRRVLLGATLLDVEQVVDVSTSAMLTGSALVTGLIARYSGGQYYWLRCELDKDSSDVVLKISHATTSAVFTDLAVLDPVPSLPYSPGTPLRVRAQVSGTRLAIKVWPAASVEPAGWHLTATDSTITAPGATGVQSWLVPGSTNTLPVTVSYRSYAARVDRFAGYADQWEPTIVTTGTGGESTSAVRITASGILRRLTQGDLPVRSALRRTIGATTPIAYWPGEEGSTSSGLASAIAGHPPLAASGTVEYVPVEDFVGGSVTLRYGSSALVDLSGGGQLAVTVPADVTSATATVWTLHVRADVDSLVIAGDWVIAEWATPGGTYVRWRMVVTAFESRLIGYTAAGTAVTLLTGNLLGGLAAWVVTARQSGGSIALAIEHGAWSTTVPGTLAGISSLVLNPTKQTASDQVVAGHIAIWPADAVPYSTLDASTDTYGGLVLTAGLSWRYETAHVRLARLAAEDGVVLDMPTVPAAGVMRMGWQEPGTLLDLYRECEAADLGVLHEHGYGLAYLPRDRRYNQPTALTIDLAAYAYTGDREQVLMPARDDQGVVNRMEVERIDGSSATAEDFAHQQRRGVYSDSVSLSLGDDGRLADQAGWRVHLGTVEDLREANFPIDLAGNPTLVDGWLSCRVGSRIARTNPPTVYPPGVLDRLVEGWTEAIGPRYWLVQVSGSPAGPWDVATADGVQRIAAAGSTLAAGITAGALTFQLTFTADNGRWTTSALDFPLHLRVGGEQVTATTISGTTSPQTVTLSARAVNGVARSWPAGTPVDVWAPAVLAL